MKTARMQQVEGSRTKREVGFRMAFFKDDGGLFGILLTNQAPPTLSSSHNRLSQGRVDQTLHQLRPETGLLRAESDWVGALMNGKRIEQRSHGIHSATCFLLCSRVLILPEGAFCQRIRKDGLRDCGVQLPLACAVEE